MKAPHSFSKKPRLLALPPESLAEIIGIMLGDGNIYINPKYGIYAIRIGGDSRLDREYLLTFVPSLFRRVFGVEVNFYFHKRHNELLIYKQSKDLVYTFGAYGLPPGDKKENNVGIPDWVISDPRFSQACIRGLIDTDGSVYPHTKRHRVPSIWFKSVIPNLRQNLRGSTS